MGDTLDLKALCRQGTVTGDSVTGTTIDRCVLPRLEAETGEYDQETGAATGMKAGIAVDHELHLVDTEVHHQDAIQTMIWACLAERHTRYPTFRFSFSMKDFLGMSDVVTTINCRISALTIAATSYDTLKIPFALRTCASMFSS